MYWITLVLLVPPHLHKYESERMSHDQFAICYFVTTCRLAFELG